MSISIMLSAIGNHEVPICELLNCNINERADEKRQNPPTAPNNHFLYPPICESG